MENKAKDRQPMKAHEGRDSTSEKAHGKRENWDVDNLADEASQKDVNEIQRQVLRGDETKGNPDERDIAGGAHPNETAQGREEAKNDVKGKANVNG